MGTYDTIGGTPRHDPMADYFPLCDVCGKDPSTDCECCEICNLNKATHNVTADDGIWQVCDECDPLTKPLLSPLDEEDYPDEPGGNLSHIQVR